MADIVITAPITAVLPDNSFQRYYEEAGPTTPPGARTSTCTSDSSAAA